MDFSSHRSSWVDFDNRALVDGLTNPLAGRRSVTSLRSMDSLSQTHEDSSSTTNLSTPSSETSIEARRPSYSLSTLNGSIDMLRGWLVSLNLADYYDAFVSNDITYDVLAYLRKEDLKEFIPKVGDRVRIWKAVKNLQYQPWSQQQEPTSSQSNQSKSPGPLSSTSDLEKPVSVTFMTAEKSMHLSLTPTSAVRPTISQTLKLPSESYFSVHDEFDFYDSESSLKDAIFRKGVREFWISRDEAGPAFALANADGSSAPSSGTPSDDQTMIVSRENILNVGSKGRPTSHEVTSRLSDFFPGSKQELLEEGLRNSLLINRRFSTLTGGWRTSVRSSRRFSKLPSLESSEPKALERPKTSALSQNLHALDIGQESELLEQLDNEEMSPSEWLRGKIIGSGSFGSVYLAFNVFSGDIMAVKQVQLIERDQRQKKMVEALRQEIRTLRDLEHESIVQYRGFKKEGEYLNIFLEYVPGGSLATTIANNGPLKEHTVREYIKQCLSGLAYLHDRGIIHRDIKGANILVDTNNRVKISDFGLSKHEDNAKQRYSMQGTAFWMAPEVARAREQTTTKADIWSLGCLIIELVTGQHPFPHLQAFQALYRIGKGVSPDIPEQISSNLSDLLKQCLDVDPRKRSSAQKLLKHPFITEEN